MKYRCETKELAIGYGSAPLASGITLGAVPGQILALIGPNGAGKSTLLKTLAGQLAPLGGAVLLDGRSLTDYTGTARARKLALMLPHTRRTELTSCFEFAAAGRIPYTGRLGILSDADRQAVRDALELVGASPLAGRDFNCISDGQRQRVLLVEGAELEARREVDRLPLAWLVRVPDLDRALLPEQRRGVQPAPAARGPHTGADLEVAKDGDGFAASFDYEREIHLGGPAYLVYRFSGSSKK